MRLALEASIASLPLNRSLLVGLALLAGASTAPAQDQRVEGQGVTTKSTAVAASDSDMRAQWGLMLELLDKRWLSADGERWRAFEWIEPGRLMREWAGRKGSSGWGPSEFLYELSGDGRAIRQYRPKNDRTQFALFNRGDGMLDMRNSETGRVSIGKWKMSGSSEFTDASQGWGAADYRVVDAETLAKATEGQTRAVILQADSRKSQPLTVAASEAASFVSVHPATPSPGSDSQWGLLAELAGQRWLSADGRDWIAFEWVEPGKVMRRWHGDKGLFNWNDPDQLILTPAPGGRVHAKVPVDRGAEFFLAVAGRRAEVRSSATSTTTTAVWDLVAADRLTIGRDTFRPVDAETLAMATGGTSKSIAVAAATGNQTVAGTPAAVAPKVQNQIEVSDGRIPITDAWEFYGQLAKVRFISEGQEPLILRESSYSKASGGFPETNDPSITTCYESTGKCTVANYTATYDAASKRINVYRYDRGDKYFDHFAELGADGSIVITRGRVQSKMVAGPGGTLLMECVPRNSCKTIRLLPIPWKEYSRLDQALWARSEDIKRAEKQASREFWGQIGQALRGVRQEFEAVERQRRVNDDLIRAASLRAAQEAQGEAAAAAAAAAAMQPSPSAAAPAAVSEPRGSNARTSNTSVPAADGASPGSRAGRDSATVTAPQSEIPGRPTASGRDGNKAAGKQDAAGGPICPGCVLRVEEVQKPSAAEIAREQAEEAKRRAETDAYFKRQDELSRQSLKEALERQEAAKRVRVPGPDPNGRRGGQSTSSQ